MYDVSANIILDSCTRAVSSWDVITSMIKSWVFGTIIAIVRAPCHVLGRAHLQSRLRACTPLTVHDASFVLTLTLLTTVCACCDLCPSDRCVDHTLCLLCVVPKLLQCSGRG